MLSTLKLIHSYYVKEKLSTERLLDISLASFVPFKISSSSEKTINKREGVCLSFQCLKVMGANLFAVVVTG